MFFSLSKTIDPRFPCNDRIGSWILNHDLGWQNNDCIWFKGYRYADINHGNFCQIHLDSNHNEINLTHDLERSFPLWWDSQLQVLTNCLGQGEQIWIDKKIRLLEQHIEISRHELIKEINLDPLPITQVIGLIDTNLRKKFHLLKQQKIPLKLFPSGGVDTLAMLCYARDIGLDCEIVNYEYFHYDHFTNQLFASIKSRHWAYQQIHHWTDACMFLTGACGDEYMFRGPTTIAMWAAWHDIELIPLIEKCQGYHRYYFLLEKNRKLFDLFYSQRLQLRKKFPQKHDLAYHLVDMNLNDHQHWHLGNTLTWTPFKDIEIFKLLLRVPIDELIEQWINADISKQLISDKYRVLLSDQKNCRPRHNLVWSKLDG